MAIASGFRAIHAIDPVFIIWTDLITGRRTLIGLNTNLSSRIVVVTLEAIIANTFIPLNTTFAAWLTTSKAFTVLPAWLSATHDQI